MYKKYVQDMLLVNGRAPLTVSVLGGSFQHSSKSVRMNITPTRFSLPKELCGHTSLGNVDYVGSRQ